VKGRIGEERGGGDGAKAKERKREQEGKEDKKCMMRRNGRENNSGEKGRKGIKKMRRGKKGKGMKRETTGFLLIPCVQKRLSEMTEHVGSNGNAHHFWLGGGP
jgi:hypothetical protein